MYVCVRSSINLSSNVVFYFFRPALSLWVRGGPKGFNLHPATARDRDLRIDNNDDDFSLILGGLDCLRVLSRGGPSIQRRRSPCQIPPLARESAVSHSSSLPQDRNALLRPVTQRVLSPLLWIYSSANATSRNFGQLLSSPMSPSVKLLTIA